MTAARALVCLLAIAVGALIAELQVAMQADPTDVDLGEDDGIPSCLASPW